MNEKYDHRSYKAMYNEGGRGWGEEEAGIRRVGRVK